MKAVAIVFIMLLLTVEIAGCGRPNVAPPKPALTGPQEQSLSYRGGPERRIYEAPFVRIWDASLAALGQLNIQVRKATPVLGQIEARDPEGNPVILELSPQGEGQTCLEVQTLTGYEQTASNVHRAVSGLLRKTQ